MIDCISFFGLGKLGLPLAALFARSGVRTFAVDVDQALIARLRSGEVPYVEPGLEELLAEAEPTITYLARPDERANPDASIILVATPSDGQHPEFSSAQVEQACRDL